MSIGVDKQLTLTSSELKDLETFCSLNGLDPDKVIKSAYLQGFRIEKYGLLGATGTQEKIVEKEVIVEKRVEVPVEVIIEKPVIEYVEIEKEIIKEVPREVIVEKVVEVIKEIPVEKVVEKTLEIIKEVPVDRVVVQEVIKEVPVEKVVTRTEYVTDDSKVAELVAELERVRNSPPTIVDREVIKEVPVPYEVVKEVEVIKEVTVEVPVEIPVEVIKEVMVEKTIPNESLQRLQETLAKVRESMLQKDQQIKDLNDEISKLKSLQEHQKAVYLKGSNLDDKLYR
jgi:hypothetical protein